MKRLKGYALTVVLISIVLMSLTYIVIPIKKNAYIHYAKERIDAIYDTHFNTTE